MDELEILQVNDPQDLALALDIRRVVFCQEQGVSEEIEIDGRDDQCRHYLVMAGRTAVATARTRKLADGEIKIERVAVLARYRGKGIGRDLMKKITADIGSAPMVLHAQLHSADFYERLGFSAEGGVFDEAGIPHVRMIFIQ